MERAKGISELQNKQKLWDLVVIGGGASGLGVALDALSRGLSVALFERSDFAKGTSSRSTKLLHGGVRYLAQGDVALVFEALKERGLLMKNAPHVSRKQSFIIPIYSFWDKLKYGVGLKAYDLMAGSLRIGKSSWLPKGEVIAKIPAIKQEGLMGGVQYFDGQFDDARLALNIAQTCADLGGCILNYMSVTDLTKDSQGLVNGVKVRDEISQESFEVKATAVVNATGVFSDAILKMNDPKAGRSIVPSQGAHLVLDLAFLGGKDALMIPQTTDGRVLFGIPWHDKLVLGTTDTIRKDPKPEPTPLEEEIDFILQNCADYLVRPPKREDVLAVYAGLRPLAATKKGETKTKEISRSHKIFIADSHLITLIGGKWTTFRKMGEDTLEAYARLKHLKLQKSKSEHIRLHGYSQNGASAGHLAAYGSDAANILTLIKENMQWQKRLHASYPITHAEVVWMARNEMAQTVEDILARRNRILFLDAKAAKEMAPAVARILCNELGHDEQWEKDQLTAFNNLADNYQLKTSVA